jgi:hypothetical protein
MAVLRDSVPHVAFCAVPEAAAVQGAGRTVAARVAGDQALVKTSATS